MDASAQAKGALAAAVAGAAADLSRGMSSISPAEQMAIVEAAQRAALESDGGRLIARNHSSDEATVGSWVCSMEAVWGSLAAVEARKQQNTDNNIGSNTGSNTGNSSGSSSGDGSRAAEGPGGGAAACRTAAGPAVNGAAGAASGAAGDGRTAVVGAQGSDVQQQQAGGAVDLQQLQPAIATQAS